MLQVRSDQVPVPLPLCPQRTPLCAPPITQPHPHWPCSLYLHSQSLCFLTLSALRGWSQAESIISSFYIWINRGSKGLSIWQENMFNRHKDPGLLPPGPHQKAPHTNALVSDSCPEYLCSAQSLEVLGDWGVFDRKSNSSFLSHLHRLALNTFAD